MSNTSAIFLEHLNLTVSDPGKTAQLLCELFDWKIRWQGPSLDEGHTVHVGLDDFYLALYSPMQDIDAVVDNYAILNGLNHIGVVVDNIEEIESRVKAAGIETHHYAEFEPVKRRFYFDDYDGVEYEVVSY